MEKNTKYFLFTVIIMLSFFFYFKHTSFSRNKSFVKGYFIRKVFWPKSGTNYIARFEYKGKFYEASTKLSGTNLDVSKFEKNAIGREIMICFDSTNPSSNYVLVTRYEYRINGIKFLDYLDSLTEN